MLYNHGVKWIYEGCLQMRELFNEYVKSMTTYIMFKIKAAANKLRPELESKGRAPIFL